MRDRQTEPQKRMITAIVPMVEAVVFFTGGRELWENEMEQKHRREGFGYVFSQSPHKVCRDAFSWIRTSIASDRIFSLPTSTKNVEL